jgi:CRP-like cAMP-binding protein
MTLDNDIALLRRVPLFADLPTEEIRLLAFSAVRLDLAADQVLFREGARANSGYVIAAGGIRLTVGPKRKVVANCETGALIGELALLVETRRPATATATVASQVLELDRKLIVRMLSEYPEVAVKWREILSERLLSTVTDLGKVRGTLKEIGKTPSRR